MEYDVLCIESGVTVGCECCLLSQLELDMLYWEERTVQAASLAPTTVTTLTRLSHLTEFYMKTGGVAGQQSSHHQLDGTYRGLHVSSD